MINSSNIGNFTESTRVLLSFGSVAGGFEFAMQLRKDIMNKYGKNDTNVDFVYLDAESLKTNSSTLYTWDPQLGIYKMSNKLWDTYYQKAMSKCDFMVFLISAPWLQKWCWQEFKWYSYAISQKSIKPVFIVFPDARRILDGSAMVTDKDGRQQSLKLLWNDMITRGCVVDIVTLPIDGPGTVSVDGQTYTYDHKYVCSPQERSNILKNIVVLQP